MSNPAGTIMTPWQQFWSRLRGIAIRARRKLPCLVWHGDEVDVRVTLFDDALQDDASMQGGLRQFQTGEYRAIEQKLRELGIMFDSGIGAGGRDWEWDWSLKGPISVAFRRRTKMPQYRASAQTLNATMKEIRSKLGLQS